ncbi:GAL4 enhancer protein [Tieghemiomyces parasiticus]|uniref:Nascent polypeptide-associated complex subunit alpha n=1 Tax=Tieghemiomyces parasiticus TaxID=78921 RepID=A0A9W8AE03_9FUNG|nr:GAL4 enhancer protein [Tieghemiomyces parasiticus]
MATETATQQPQQVEEVQQQQDAQVVDQSPAARMASRTEKKARKAMVKQGLNPVEGIARVTLLRPRGIVYAINRPDVYKSAHSDTYIVFGEAKVEDMGAQAQMAARARAQQAQEATNAGADGASSAAGAIAGAEEGQEAEEDDGEEVDASGVSEKDIEIVMTQAHCSRNKAIKALKTNENDVVNAIMELTL